MTQIWQWIAVQQQQRQYQTPEQILESLFSNIIEFVFDEENGVTFGRCCLTATRTSSRTMQASWIMRRRYVYFSGSWTPIRTAAISTTSCQTFPRTWRLKTQSRFSIKSSGIKRQTFRKRFSVFSRLLLTICRWTLSKQRALNRCSNIVDLSQVFTRRNVLNERSIVHVFMVEQVHF